MADASANADRFRGCHTAYVSARNPGSRQRNVCVAWEFGGDCECRRQRNHGEHGGRGGQPNGVDVGGSQPDLVSSISILIGASAAARTRAQLWHGDADSEHRSCATDENEFGAEPVETAADGRVLSTCRETRKKTRQGKYDGRQSNGVADQIAGCRPTISRHWVKRRRKISR